MTSNLPLRHMEYRARIVADRSTISLRETSKSDRERVIAVELDDRFLGEFSLISIWCPSVGVGNRHVVLWGNTDLYVIDRDGYSLTAFPQDEPILAAFPIDHRWCLVREISIVIVDLDRRTIEEIFDYDEVLRTYRWNGNRLFVKDFYGRQLTFDVSTGVPSLRRGPFYSFQ